MIFPKMRCVQLLYEMRYTLDTKSWHSSCISQWHWNRGFCSLYKKDTRIFSIAGWNSTQKIAKLLTWKSIGPAMAESISPDTPKSERRLLIPPLPNLVSAWHWGHVSLSRWSWIFSRQIWNNPKYGDHILLKVYPRVIVHQLWLKIRNPKQKNE